MSRFIGIAQGNTALQTREPKWQLELPTVAPRFAKAASNPPWREKVRSSGLVRQLTVEKYVPLCLRLVEAAECNR
jgi:hypothetical protein